MMQSKKNQRSTKPVTWEQDQRTDHLAALVTNQRTDHLAILATLSKFYAEKKFSDVEVQIGDEIFSASRFMLASLSEFFEKMFYSDFKESNSDGKPIVLGELDASAFKDILDAMFTGNIRVNDSNVFALLRASHYLLLRSFYVEDQCFEYLVSNSSEPLSDAFEILTFAHLAGKERFVDRMNFHILEHASHFSEDIRCLDIPFDALVGLFKYRGGNDISRVHPAFYKTEDALLKLVTRWINHSRQQRSTYRSQLMSMINLSSVSAKYALSLLRDCENFIDRTVGHDENVDVKELYVAGLEDNEFEFMWEVDCEFVRYEIVEGIKLNSPTYTFYDEQWKIVVYCADEYDDYSGDVVVVVEIIHSNRNPEKMSDIKTELSIVAQRRGEDLIRRCEMSAVKRNTYCVRLLWSEIVEDCCNSIIFKARIFT